MPALPPSPPLPSSDDYASTARFLANPPPPRHTTPTTKRTPSTSRGRLPSSPSLFPRFTSGTTERLSFNAQWPRDSLSTGSVRERVGLVVRAGRDRADRFLGRFTPLQRVVLGVGAAVAAVLGLLLLVFNERIFAGLVPLVERWRSSPVGWLILWLVVFAVSFPPMIGYSTCFTLGGFVFGVWKGYLILATATVAGSTASFVVSRLVFKDYVERLTRRDTRFEALSGVVKRDGLKLLIMIRLCPLPYSISNGAISTIPSVSPGMFALATAAASPKLLIGLFIGSRLGNIAEGGAKMDAGSKVVSYISIVVGIALGVGTGWVMYTKTMKRAREIEEEERAGRSGSRSDTRARGRDDEAGLTEGDFEYTDGDVDDDDAVRGPDGISLHTTEGDGDVYRDDFGDEDGAADASSLDAVFQAGDGDDSDAEGRGYRDDDNEDRR
ncbi:hypothetical protein CAC42_1836 [Sphaceloma murrayae]|uniref:Golgi apparatus membrane protein TVP38 n=1 Tax=Sphaceloma murrayae TaxID=2082308 RepID=A0A2K1QVW7_9PEZI|nr:hypothetical protein CAC42_1836 [Sphaceloma murrayae]